MLKFCVLLVLVILLSIPTYKVRDNNTQRESVDIVCRCPFYNGNRDIDYTFS